MADVRAKWALGGGELPENFFGREYIVAGGEGPETSASASEHLESLGFGDGPGDYGIWTSPPEPLEGEVRRKKAA
jgi:hypothetical protein